MDYIEGNDIVLDKFTAITLGNFDGIHLGHRKLIDTVKQYAGENDMLSVVCSFLPHPKLVFKDQENFALILTPQEKYERIAKMGVDCYINFLFTEKFANISAEQFAEKYLFQQLKCKIVVVGEDYTFGSHKKGTPELLKKIGAKYDAKVITIPKVMIDGQLVSSSRIRSLLEKSELEQANELLHEPYSIIGTVVEGKKLGRTLGFPTLNILADPIKLFPSNGVYATRTLYSGITYNSVTNIGYNPTVDGKVKTIETNVLDFNQFVYGQTIEVQFLKFFRPEKAFNSVDELKLQIDSDSLKARAYFASLQ
jgi:riboflavin kinase/FMN adenylyltransferase